jgi:hypothetical protein
LGYLRTSGPEIDDDQVQQPRLRQSSFFTGGSALRKLTVLSAPFDVADEAVAYAVMLSEGHHDFAELLVRLQVLETFSLIVQAALSLFNRQPL